MVPHLPGRALIATGLSNGEIAETTVKTHINRIFAKTQSRDRAQAAVYAHQHVLAAAPCESGPGAGA